MPEEHEKSDSWLLHTSTTTVAEALAEVHQVLDGLDSTELKHMNETFYAHAYESLDVVVRRLLHALQTAGIDRRRGEGIELVMPELIESLRGLLGDKLVAYMASVEETSTVAHWADPADTTTPSAEVAVRLIAAHHAAALLSRRDSAAVVQAWFQGRNPMLDEVAPARCLRENELAEVAPRLLAAARAFAAAP